MEDNASLFTSDTTTPCDFNITEDKPDLEINSKCKLDSKTLLEFIHKANINIEILLAIPIYNIMTLIMVMHLISKTNILHYYNKNCKIPTGVYMIPL